MDPNVQHYVNQHHLHLHWLIKIRVCNVFLKYILQIKWVIFKFLGKTRYGVCVNFYRPTERSVNNGGNGGNTGIKFKRDKQNIRRDSWRKSMEKSSDSAFSR